MDTLTLAPPELTGLEDDTTRKFLEARHYLRQARYPTLTPLLPLILNLNGAPYSIRDHFPFEPFFHTRMPRKLLVRSGRQVSKSTSIAAQGVLLSACKPYYKTLYITPLYEQIRKFSTNYVRPFIEHSPVRNLLVGPGCTQSVLQKTFRNQSELLFNFAYLDCDRVRGTTTKRIIYDELQNLDPDFIGIINECMSAYPEEKQETAAGTPLSLDNLLERKWKGSSQAEWIIRCHHGGCGYFNIPALGHDLVEMIGPWRPDISEAEPGLVCAKCQKPLRPRAGRWVHGYPDRRWEAAGYHVPQVIMPMHYKYPDAWRDLLAKMRGAGGFTEAMFFNEVCGEGFDRGSKIITLTDLMAAATLPWRNKLAEAPRGDDLDRYIHRVIAVDWGGGGQEEVSFTVIAVLGMLPDGTIHVLFGHRSRRMHEHLYEAALVLKLMQHFRCTHLAHDFNGAGDTRETFIIQSGLPMEQIRPMVYTRAAVGPIMKFQRLSNTGMRAHYRVDRSRSLQLTCQEIKLRKVLFFQDDHVSDDEPGLIRDFLALLEEKMDSQMGRDIYKIIRDPTQSDDFAQAVNMGCCALWDLCGQWPNLADQARLILTPDFFRAVHPPRLPLSIDDLDL